MSQDPEKVPTWRIEWWSAADCGREEKTAASAIDAAAEAQQVNPRATVLRIELLRCPAGYEWPR